MRPLKLMLRKGIALLALGVVVILAAPLRAAEPIVVELSQTPCQFVEIEGGDLGFESARKADCERINAETGADRLAAAKVLRLKPGDYIFRVTNKTVPYALGFWLREDGYENANVVKRLTMTSVSGGGLELGTTKDYEVELEPGEYIFSCPLNSTPNYRIVVEG